MSISMKEVIRLFSKLVVITIPIIAILWLAFVNSKNFILKIFFGYFCGMTLVSLLFFLIFALFFVRNYVKNMKLELQEAFMVRKSFGDAEKHENAFSMIIPEENITMFWNLSAKYRFLKEENWDVFLKYLDSLSSEYKNQVIKVDFYIPSKDINQNALKSYLKKSNCNYIAL